MARLISHPAALTGLSLYGCQPRNWREFDLQKQRGVFEEFGNVVDTFNGCVLHSMKEVRTKYYLEYVCPVTAKLHIARIPWRVCLQNSAKEALAWKLAGGEMSDDEEDEGSPKSQTIEEHRHTAIRQGMSEEQWEKIQRRFYKLSEDQLRPLYDVPLSKRGFGTHEE